MTLAEELLDDFSKIQMVRLSRRIGPNQEDFDEVVELLPRFGCDRCGGIDLASLLEAVRRQFERPGE